MDDCMLWARSTTQNGYAHISVKENGKFVTRLLHRELYLIEIGEIPDGLVLDHLCHNRNCINTQHLEPVTFEENLRRGAAFKHPSTHCPQGHKLKGNSYLILRGTRLCKTCNKIRGSANYLKRKNA